MKKIKNTGLILNKWDFIILLGESGGGKGTLVKNIKKYWMENLTSASMGDIIRSKAQTDPEIKKLTESGILIEDSVVFNLFCEFAKGDSFPALMDGFPRTRIQALEVISFLQSMGWRVLVIDLTCSLEKIIERLLTRNRSDDKLNIIYKRNADHKNLHPAVMQEIKARPDLFDIIYLNGNNPEEITFTNFLLDVLRLVDIEYVENIEYPASMLTLQEGERTVNPAINRWICKILDQIEERI